MSDPLSLFCTCMVIHEQHSYNYTDQLHNSWTLLRDFYKKTVQWDRIQSKARVLQSPGVFSNHIELKPINNNINGDLIVTVLDDSMSLCTKTTA